MNQHIIVSLSDTKLGMKVIKFILLGSLLALFFSGLYSWPQQTTLSPGWSPRVLELLLQGEREQAARYLSDSLSHLSSQSSTAAGKEYLTLAILWFLSDSAEQARSAYNIYIGRGMIARLTRTEEADRLLYHSFSLDNEEEYHQASDSLVKSLVIRNDTSLSGKILTAESCRALARLNKKNGDEHQALRNYQRSLQINRELHRTACIADDLTEMSTVISQIDKGDPEADRSLYEALRLYKSLPKTSSVSTVYNELGVLHAARGSLEPALYYLKRSLEIKERLPVRDIERELAVINNIGTIYFYKRNTDSSDYFFFRALDVARENGLDPAPLYVNLGINYTSKGDFDNGLKYFQLAISSLDSLCNPDDPDSNPRIEAASPNLAEITSYKAHAFNKRFLAKGNHMDLVKGLETYQVALGMMDTLRYLYSFESKPLMNQEFKIHYFHALEMALDLYAHTDNPKFLSTAFELAGRNKASTLNEFLRTNEARKYLGASIREIVLEDSLKQALVKLQNIQIENRLKNAPSQLTEETSRAITRTTDQLISLQAAIRRENPDLFRLIYSSQGYPPDSIRQLLSPDEALVDYTMTDSSYLAAFVLTRDTIHYFRDTLGKQFFSDINLFRGAITSNVSSSNYQDFIRYSHTMFLNLIAPARIPSPIRKLIILPDEEIGFLPFEIFISDTLRPEVSDFSQLHYLNRIWAISYISSLEQLVQSRRDQSRHPVKGIIAMAPFTTSGVHTDKYYLPPLRFSQMELDAISKDYRLKRYVGRKANQEALEQAFKSNSILQISTHGIVDLEKPIQTRILLSPGKSDGNMYLFEMLSAKINNPLVVLNACNTGIGRLQVGEGILSMSKALQFAGVPSLVTTLWPVDDRSSAQVMSYFFKNLKTGMDKRVALQEARNRYLDETTLTLSAPYFWAGQVLIGDPDPISVSNLRPAWFFLPAGTLILIILIAGYIRRKRRTL